MLNRDFIFNLIKKDNDVIYQSDFFELLKETSLLEFRKNINIVQDIRTSLFLEERVKKYYDELLSQYNDNSKLFFRYDEIIKDFSNNNYTKFINDKFDYFLDKKLSIKLQDYLHYSDGMKLIYKELLMETNKKISEIVVDGLFGDTIYNVWINIREMLRYNDLLNEDKKLLDKEKEEFYKLILDIDKIDCIEKIKMYNNLKNKNIALMFYKDLRMMKNDSYEKIKSSLFKVHEHEELLNKDKSIEYGIPIYELETDNFYILISCRDSFKEFDCIRRHCYSLISDTNMKVFNKNKFIYGYTNFDIDRILHVFEHDSYSSNGNGSSKNSFTTKRVNRIIMPNQISSTMGYSEIQIINKKIDENKFIAMKPDYLVVFANIEIKHMEEAKKLNIPIIKIDTKSYIERNNKSDNNVEYLLNYEKINDDYTDGEYQENLRSLRRIKK